MSRDDDAFPTAALAAPPTRRGVLAMAGPLAASLLAAQAALAQATGARRTVPIPVDVAALARLTIAAARTAPAREEPDDPESATARLDRIFADAARRWEAAPSSAAARALRQGLDDIARTGDPT